MVKALPVLGVVNPDVAVMSPEIVGVAVQAVPVTVRFPPRVVSPVPSKVRVGLVVTFPRVNTVVFAEPATMVEPRRVRVPGVVAEPIVLIDDAPDPKVFVNDDPVPIVEAPEEVSVVKEPALPEMGPAILANVAAPAAVTDQLLSVIETPVAVALPIAIVLATAALPILIVFAFVAPVPILTVEAPSPVARFNTPVAELVPIVIVPV
jgi:hypothetical protein